MCQEATAKTSSTSTAPSRYLFQQAGMAAVGYHFAIHRQWSIKHTRNCAEKSTEFSKILDRALGLNNVNFSPSGEAHAAHTGRICFTVGTHVLDSCCLLGHVDFAFSYVFLGTHVSSCRSALEITKYYSHSTCTRVCIHRVCVYTAIEMPTINKHLHL